MDVIIKVALTTGEARNEGLVNSRTITVYKHFDYSYRKAYKGKTATGYTVIDRTTTITYIADLEWVAKSF